MIRTLSIDTPHGRLHGRLELPESPRGLVLLARALRAPVDTIVAGRLAARGYAVLIMELLTTQEAQFVDATQNVPRLAQRLISLLDLVRDDGDTENLPLAIYALGDSSPAALRAAAQRDAQVRALACHGGLLDHAGLQSLTLNQAPLLMLIDTTDQTGQTAWQRTAAHLQCAHEMHVLGPLEDPVTHIASWFSAHMGG